MQDRELDLIKLNYVEPRAGSQYDEDTKDIMREITGRKRVITDKHEVMRLLFEEHDAYDVDESLLHDEEFIQMLIENAKEQYKSFCNLIIYRLYNDIPKVLLLREVHYAAIRHNGRNCRYIPERLFIDLDLCRVAIMFYPMIMVEIADFHDKHLLDNEELMEILIQGLEVFPYAYMWFHETTRNILSLARIVVKVCPMMYKHVPCEMKRVSVCPRMRISNKKHFTKLNYIDEDPEILVDALEGCRNNLWDLSKKLQYSSTVSSIKIGCKQDEFASVHNKYEIFYFLFKVDNITLYGSGVIDLKEFSYDFDVITFICVGINEDEDVRRFVPDWDDKNTSLFDFQKSLRQRINPIKNAIR